MRVRGAAAERRRPPAARRTRPPSLSLPDGDATSASAGSSPASTSTSSPSSAMSGGRCVGRWPVWIRCRAGTTLMQLIAGVSNSRQRVCDFLWRRWHRTAASDQAAKPIWMWVGVGSVNDEVGGPSRLLATPLAVRVRARRRGRGRRTQRAGHPACRPSRRRSPQHQLPWPAIMAHWWMRHHAAPRAERHLPASSPAAPAARRSTARRAVRRRATSTPDAAVAL